MEPWVIDITDCADDNARARLSARIAAHFGALPVISGVTSPRADLEAAVTLLDTLNACEIASGRPEPYPGIILVNVAPRNRASQWDNGTPFCYFYYGKNLVVATVDGQTLSLAQQYLGIQSVKLVEIPIVLKEAVAAGLLTEADTDMIANSQFRSLWFQPLLARWIWDGQLEIPFEDYQLPYMEAGPAVYYIDSFGNCVIPITPQKIGFEPGKSLRILRHGKKQRLRSTRPVTCYERLADVPAGQPGLVLGSGGTNFVTLVIQGAALVTQGADAASYFGLKIGDRIFSE